MHRTCTFPIGPQHPALKEPLFLKLQVEGSTVREAEFSLGYAHRGVEEKLEKKEVDTVLHAVQRTCGICSQCHSMAFLRTVEGIGGIEINDRVALQRVVVAELERMHSHMLWAGAMMHELGLETLFMYFLREREKVLDVFDELTGNRVHHSPDLIGTMKRNFSKEDLEFVLKTLDEISGNLKNYREAVRTHDVILDRCVGKGKITKAESKKYGLVGPVARACGINNDVRVQSPYMGYKLLKVGSVIREEGDAQARTMNRIDEVFECMKILEQACEFIPETKEIPKYPVKRIAQGEGAGRVEAPRGENFHFVRIAMGKTARVKLRTPTLANLIMYPKLLKGVDITDVPVIVMSLDPCISCMERVAVVRNGKTEVWTSHELSRGKKDA
jgi:NADH-quinone oxidoreductase subunit D